MSQFSSLSTTKIKQYFSSPAERFINREISWLAFNSRVLSEAQSPQNPLGERVRFLSISANNLDEFMMVRVAGLKDQVRHGVTVPSDDGKTPLQQLEAVEKEAKLLLQAQQECWIALRQALGQLGIDVVRVESLTERELRWLRRYFMQEIFPVLTPIAVDPAHPFPFIANLGMAILFELHAPKERKRRTALTILPAKLSRFISLTPRASAKKQRIIALEDVVMLFFHVLFPGYECTDFTMLRIIRDSDLEIEEEAEDLVRYFEKAVKERRRGRIVRAKVQKPLSDKFRQFLVDNLPVSTHDIIEVEGMIGLENLSELYHFVPTSMKFAPFAARFPERINDFEGDCFAAIQAKDIVVHHPYGSFDVVVQFLRQAAADPHVVSIKQTLYRTSSDSPIVRALIEAAEAGKSVTALVELKARFDEEANIRWARDMERAGVQVVYGFVKLKTHAKMSLVVRRVDGKLRSYAHFGTGNYHPTTAKIYTDLSFFTADKILCQDASYLFNFMTGYAKPRRLKKIIAAPHALRDRLMEMIDQEIAFAKEGKPASIWAKMNSLIDPEMIDKLYIAGQAGVQIDLVVRGICGLRPQVPNFSDNIRIKSLVGRFLEHARIVCFGNGHPLPSPNAKVFISSADWMVRNFDHRVEVLVPIEDETVHAQILDQIMVANLRDERESWIMDKDGNYSKLSEGAESFSAHDYFMTNPSLSGRGTALKQTIKQAGASALKKP